MTMHADLSLVQEGEMENDPEFQEWLDSRLEEDRNQLVLNDQGFWDKEE